MLLTPAAAAAAAACRRQVVVAFKGRYPHSRSVLVAVTADAFEDTRDR